MPDIMILKKHRNLAIIPRPGFPSDINTIMHKNNKTHSNRHFYEVCKLFGNGNKLACVTDPSKPTMEPNFCFT